jgi:SMC interacting uncharacterized protein involved in chromosome segregation
MGMTVLPKRPKRIKKGIEKKVKKIFILSPGGFSSYNSMSQEDAEILIKYKAIKSDPVRYENAKQAMKMRGY